MTLAGITPGDIVQVDDGMPYHGEVIDKAPGALTVRVLARPCMVRTVKPREITTHWRRSRAKR